MRKKGARNLTYTQRLQLEACLRVGLHKQRIAKKLGVCLSTIYNEINRGKCTQKEYSYTDWIGERHYKQVTAYSPNIAEDRYRFNMSSHGAPLKLGNDWGFVRYVEKRVLTDRLSPCAVLGEIKRKRLFRTNISKTTMYRYIEQGLFMNISLKALNLRPRRYRKIVAKRPPKGVSIEKRPNEIAKRNSFGHWEMDCVVGSTLSTLLVLTERLTRQEIIFRMPNRKAESVIHCLNVLERRYGAMFRKVFKTITVDNGSEFSDSKAIERSIFRGKRLSVYYCHPYCSCERGSNERLNREIRRLIPKGTDISKISIQDVKAVEDWVNAYPREIFDYATSAEKFDEEIAKLQ